MTEVDDSNLTNRAIAWWEIVSIVTSCLIAEWVIFAFAGRSKLIGAAPVVLALAFMIFSHRQRGESLKEIGFRFDNLVAALGWVLLLTVVVVVLIVVTGWVLKKGSFSFAVPRPRFLLIIFWALFQQYALQGFINRRAQLVFGKGIKSILLVGIVFGLLHLPNPLLTVLTLVGGVLWAAIYQRQPNLFALAVSHTIVSITLALTLAQDVFYNLRVGFKYFG